MTAPGVTVTSRAERARRGAPTDTGPLFLVGPTATGTEGEVVRLESFGDYVTVLGGRTGEAAATSDYLETYFAEGGAVAYVVPQGVASLADSLEAFSRDLGPGQVAAVGAEAAADHVALMAHAATANRTALLDAPDGTTAAAAVTLFATSRTEPGADRSGAFVGWLDVPGVGGSGATRSVPPSALVAGLIARNDARYSVNDAPAGDRGYARYALTARAGRFTDAERSALNDGGVNPVRQGFDGPQLYGFRSVSSDEAWRFLSNSRLRMALEARLAARAEQFLFRTVDGKGYVLAELRGVLLAELAAEYQRGALYGATADEAYDVTVDADPTTLAAGEVYGVAEARFSPYAERVRLDLVKAALGVGAL